ncbi:efflux RND transporter periplasmic adaptor subunit [Parvularcula mediterranea]|nr:efflux RND transporter periplasmic adaptor subunit [Parvularcula mediterranea]
MALLFLIAACGEAEESRGGFSEAPTPIVPFEVEMAMDARDVQAVGTARAKTAAAVTPETAGIVDEVVFQPGDFVEAGAPLIRLEADDERLALRLADVAVREAEQLLARYRRIENTGAVSDSAIDEARTQLEAAKINREQARLRLAERTVTAPFAGYVGLSDVDPGSRVGQDTVVAALDDRRSLFIDFTVPEDVFGQLSIGDIVEATAFSEGDTPRDARVVSLDSRVNPDSRAFRARAELDNREDTLRPGMSFEVRFSVPGRTYPLVPEAAIVWGSDGAYLWAVRDGKAERTPVRIVSREEGRVLIEAPLREGSIIVAEGVQKVRPGTIVTYEGQRRPRPSSTSGGGAGTLNE